MLCQEEKGILETKDETERKGVGGKEGGERDREVKCYSHEITEELSESWKEKKGQGSKNGWMEKEREDVLGLTMVPVDSRWKRELICLHGPAFLSAR